LNRPLLQLLGKLRSWAMVEGTCITNKIKIMGLDTSKELLYILLYCSDINLITNFRRPPFTVTSIWVELLRPSYFELAVPNDPRRSSPPDAKVEVAVSNVKSVATYSNFNFKFHQGQGSLGTTTICPHDLSLSNIHYSTS
jgi:hypothetical protein